MDIKPTIIFISEDIAKVFLLYKDPEPKHFVATPVFMSGQIISHLLNLKKNIAPFLTKSSQGLIFATLWQMLIESMIYDDFKTVLLDSALAFSAILFSNYN